MPPSFLDVARGIVINPPALAAVPSAFLTDGDTVFWQTAYGPAPLDLQNVNGLLDLFEEMDGAAARKLWLDLYDAASRTENFVPRVTSHRAEPAPKAGLRLVGAEPTEAA